MSFPPPAPLGYFGAPGTYATPGLYTAPRASAASRRAGVLMWVLGGIGTLFFGIYFLAFALLSDDTLQHVIDQGQQSMRQQGGMPAVPIGVLRVGMLVACGIGLAVALTIVALAAGVRRGRRGHTIVAGIVSAIAAIPLGLMTAGSIPTAIAFPPALVIVLILAAAEAALVVQTVLLFSSLRSAPATAAPVWGQWPPASMSLGYAAIPPPPPPASKSQ